MNTAMNRPAKLTFTMAAALALLFVATFAISMTSQSRAAAQDPTLYDPAGGTIVFPRVSIIQWGDVSVARFDSATGAVHRFSGDLDKPSTRAEWVLHVSPVRERTSGMLRFQQPHGTHAMDAPFLIDVVTGDTWILRRRGAGATWDKVEFAPR